jgi:polar amino acid transport system substrate-binding protein
MKNIVTLILLLFFSVSSYSSQLNLTQEEQDFLSSHKILKVSNELDLYPYDFTENGLAKGYSVDFIKLIADKLGIKIEFVSGSFDYLENEFKNGNIDLLNSAMKLKYREKFAVFSDAYVQLKFSLITANQDKIKSINDLKGKKLAVVKDSIPYYYIKKNLKDVVFKEFSNKIEALEAVAFGVADAIICDYFTANYIIKQDMLSNLKFVSKVDLYKDQSLYFMIQKENTILKDIINKAMKSVSDDELLDIKTRWLEKSSLEKKVLKLSEEEKQYIKNKKEIKVCIDPDWMPLEANENGLHVGISSDYMKIVAKTTNLKVKLVQTKSWIESIEFAKKRKCDIFSLAMSTPERREYMNFTKPYLHIPLVLVTTNDKLFYDDVSALKDRKIGIVRGYAYGEILRVRYPNMHLVDVENISEGLEKVEKGELFGFIGTLATVGWRIQKDYLGSLKIVGKFDESWDLGMGVRNDDIHLLHILDKVISSISREKHQEIINKWISVNYQQTKKGIPKEVLYIFAFIVLFILYRQYELKKHNSQLEKLSVTDKLTGIYNRLKLDEMLMHKKNVYDRYKRVFSVIMFDIDDFKKVNDNYGHQVGDDVLKKISSIAELNKRKSDILGRWGGEEFLIICPDTNLQGALALAEKIREEIEKYDFGIKTLTASFGVSEYSENDSIEKLIKRADDALYKAKKEGKNRVFS